MARLLIPELKDRYEKRKGHMLTSAELAKALHQEGDEFSVDYLAHLLTRWAKGERLGGCVPYLPRIAKFFGTRNINNLITTNGTQPTDT